MNKLWYVYKIIFDDDSFYIGYRGTKKTINKDFLVKYFTSSPIVRKKLKDGVSYTHQILFESFNKIDAYNEEQRLIHENFFDIHILNKMSFYNKNGCGGDLKPEVRKKMSQKCKERWLEEDFRKKMSQKGKEAWKDEDRKKQHSEYLKERWKTDEDYRNSVIKANTGRKLSEEHKKKLCVKSKEHCNKISKALKGKKKSKEHIEHLKEAFKHRKPPTPGYPVIDHKGNIFQNMSAFADYYNVRQAFFRTLDKPIRYKSVFDKLGIDYEENKNKTKSELGFRLDNKE